MAKPKKYDWGDGKGKVHSVAKRKSSVNANDLTIATAIQDEKYGPQVSQIKDLYGTAGDQRTSDIEAAKAGSQSAQMYAKNAEPGVRQIYSDATTSTNQANDDVTAAFSKIGSAADVFKAATAREQGGAKTRITSQGTAALQELIDRGVAAKAGEQLAVGKANTDYGATTKTLSQKLLDIAGARGAGIAASLGSLASDRAGNQTKIDIAKIGAGARANDRATSGAFAGMTDAEIGDLTPAQRQAKVDTFNASKGSPKKTDRRTANERQDLSAEFNKALTYAQGYKEQGDPRETASRTLLRGKPASSKGTKGKPDYEVIDAVPSFDQLALAVALDMAYDKRVSAANARKLHALGYKVSDVTGAVSSTAYQQKRSNKLAPRTPAPRGATGGSPFS